MLRSCIAFAWLNLARGDRTRVAVAIGGATVAIFIVLLHLGFLRAVEHKATQVFGLFDAEVVLVSDRYQFLYRTGDFPAARLRQALSVEGVADAAAVRLSASRWLATDNGDQSSLFLIGLDPKPDFIADTELRRAAAALGAPRRALFDALSDPDVPRVNVGESGRIGVQPALVAGTYRLGLPMYASATAVVANGDFSLYSGDDPQRIQLGLVKLAPGADAQKVVTALKSALPDDVRAMTRTALMAQEARYFVEVKPLGIMMRTGLAIGLIVGAVALFQVMSAQIEARVRDFAVLRATGFPAGYTYAIGGWQLALLGGGSFALAWLLVWPVFAVVSAKSHLFLPLDAWLLAGGVALCIPMIASAALPLLRATRADPAKLFARA
ncbi:MAG TPA: ABC transporter permease [Burkholderiales bacterium]|nr:ABC transporter permease [Burkholderiales bacterium]